MMMKRKTNLRRNWRAQVLLLALSSFTSTCALLFTSPPRKSKQGVVGSDRIFSSGAGAVDSSGFGTRSKSSTKQTTRRLYNSNRATTTEDAVETDIETSWSRPSRRDSRLGVRRRVKAVLARARERTGVVNDSELQQQQQRGDNMLGSDSSLGLDATLASGWSLGDAADGLDDDFAGDLEPDFLYSDATLSMGAAAAAALETTTTATVTTPAISAASPIKLNGFSRKNGIKNGASITNEKNGKAVPFPETLRGGGPNGANAASTSSSSSNGEDVVADNPLEQPLPFTLPTLSTKQKELVEAGERVQEQSKMGGEGKGFVVMDVKAPSYAVWEVLLDFEAYPQNIGTVRDMRMFTNKYLKESFYSETMIEPGAVVPRHYGKASISRASFILSKFRLKIAAIHKYQPHPDGHYMVFTLDKGCKNVVLQDAKGIWYTESEPDGRKGVTRVWLLCELKVSSLLPKFIVDYAAKRAMPRATTWLPPVVDRYLEEHGSKDEL